jgi:hypothetical protein
MVGLIYDELIEGLWPNSNYSPGIRPERLTAKIHEKSPTSVGVPTEIRTGNFPNICHKHYSLRQLASKYSLISFLPYYGGLVLITKFRRWFTTQSRNTVFYIATNCIYRVAETGLQLNMATRAHYLTQVRPEETTPHELAGQNPQPIPSPLPHKKEPSIIYVTSLNSANSFSCFTQSEPLIPYICCEDHLGNAFSEWKYWTKL